MAKGRGLGIGVLVLVAVIAGILYVILTSLDSIVAAAIEKYGSQATQTPVRVSAVSIDLTSGEGSINELTVGNPSGFSAPNIFTLGGISTRIELKSVTEDPVVIDEIMVKSPHVVYEINQSGKSNLDALKENLAKSSRAPEPSADSGKGEGPGLVIRKLVIESGEIDADVAALPGKDLSAKVPRIELTNVGEKEGGATASEVAEQVLSALIKHVGPVVASLGVEKYLGKSLDEVKALGEGLTGDGLKQEGAIEEGAEKLKGLLGK